MSAADCIPCGRGMCAWCDPAVEDTGTCCCGDVTVLPELVEDDLSRELDEEDRRTRAAMRRAS
jgi:hypothetical protein